MILLGWELGAYRGHIEVVRSLADHLLTAGHDVALALQHVDAAGLSLDPRIALWQAPLWPRLLGSLGGGAGQSVITMGDIIGRMGLDRPGCLAAMIGAWDRIMAAVKPDIVIADYAPALLCAARGRVPTISVGPGFTQPPAGAAQFSALADGEPIYDESALLDIADADLVSTGRTALAALPALFAADHVLISSFPALDPYLRTNAQYCAPSVKLPVSGPVAGGEELFVYAYPLIPPDSAMWDGLAAVDMKVRIHMFGATPAHQARFAKSRFTFEAQPVPFTQIAARSRIALSYGGHGFTAACLLAGLPSVALSFDLEKQLTGAALARHGFGNHARLIESDATSIAAIINVTADDSAIAARVEAAAPAFHAAMEPPLTKTIAFVMQRYLV